ncbi:cysteine proteinase [Schizophyllum amplum]|uniref:Ubiquitin carboxyl-terminal hydrolase n=1 Tax=Schizophyllum amplum TaxID=97359 RepID=A0A550CEK8_9AGAR|nr:cysteine proteinase [Auriculariopsis ampla]
MPITLKHSGASYSLDISSVATASDLRDLVARTTGVPADRVKVMLPKGKGVMKDDFKPSTLKDGATLTAVGSATAAPQPPPEPRVFLEDLEEGGEPVMDTPAGLVNLGNTCYMNSTLQAIGCVEELRTELLEGNSTGGPLVNPLATLLRSLERTKDGVNPMSFLSALRSVNPQFAERDRAEKSAAMMSMGMGGYAQQDAEESYSFILNALRSVKKNDVPVVEKYAMGVMRRSLKAADGSEDASSFAEEDFLKLECNITRETGDLLGGLRATLTQTIVKNSPVTGAPADYIQNSCIARLPAYLSVHMVRFAWRPDIGKRTKVMRKVKFPLVLDALELCTDELKEKLTPVNRKLGDVERARRDRAKIHARRKGLATAAVKSGGGPAGGMGGTSGGAAISAEATTVAGGEDPNAMQVDEDENEPAIRAKEAEELRALIPQDVKADVGASTTGLYDLVAIITHKGAAADSGHYMAFVRKNVYQKRIGVKKDTDLFDEDEDWYRFDDDKVSIFPKEKIATLDGGGEDSSAYVLLYKSRSLE